MREENRKRLRRECDRMVGERGEVLLLSELLTKESDVGWLRERKVSESWFTGKKAVVLLRGRASRL